MTASIASPCTKVCVIDPRNGLCLGCRRTLDEIAGWPEYDDAQKREVLARLSQRRPARETGEQHG